MKKLIYKLVVHFRRKFLNIDERPVEQIAIDNGMTVGKNFDCLGGCILDPGFSWLITIGDNVTFAPRVHILAHDASMKKTLGYTKVAPVCIGNNVFVGANSIILPGVTIGDNVVIGAGSVVTRSVESNSVCVGNPARFIKTYDEYMDKCKKNMETKPRYNEDYTVNYITPEKRVQMLAELKENGMGFII